MKKVISVCSLVVIMIGGVLVSSGTFASAQTQSNDNFVVEEIENQEDVAIDPAAVPAFAAGYVAGKAVDAAYNWATTTRDQSVKAMKDASPSLPAGYKGGASGKKYSSEQYEEELQASYFGR